MFLQVNDFEGGDPGEFNVFLSVMGLTVCLFLVGLATGLGLLFGIPPTRKSLYLAWAGTLAGGGALRLSVVLSQVFSTFSGSPETEGIGFIIGYIAGIIGGVAAGLGLATQRIRSLRL